MRTSELCGGTRESRRASSIFRSLLREPSPPNVDLTTVPESVNVFPPTPPADSNLSVGLLQLNQILLKLIEFSMPTLLLLQHLDVKPSFVLFTASLLLSSKEKQISYYLKLICFSFYSTRYTPLINFSFNHRGCETTSVEIGTLGIEEVCTFPKLVAVGSKYRSQLKPRKQTWRFWLRRLLMAEGLFYSL